MTVRGQRLLETVGLAAAVGLTAVLVDRLVDVALPYKAAWLAGAVLFGYAAADLMSGVAHWLGDRVFSPTTPFFGPAFVQPFREHHVAPRAMTRHGFLETNGNSAICALGGLGPAALVPVQDGSPWSACAVAATTAAMLALSATNQIHKWAHVEAPPPVVAALQRWGVILPPSRHAVHHAPPHDVDYCITTGWWNGPLARARLFERLEWLLARAPRRSSASSPRSI